MLESSGHSSSVQENQLDTNDVFGIYLPPEVITNIFRFFKPPELEKLATVSKKLQIVSNDNYIWRLSLKNNFGIEFGEEMNLKKFSLALTKQKQNLWSYYNWECLIQPCPSDVSLFLKNLFENPGEIYKKYRTQNFGGLPYAIEVASMRGWTEMVIYLISKGHLVPLTKARSLCDAIQNCHISIVRLLINSGVDVTECQFEINNYQADHYNGGNITLETVPLSDDVFHNMCPLAYAVKLNEYDENIKKNEDRVRIKEDRVRIAELLLDSGASFDDLSCVHPINKDYNKEKQRTVTQLITEGKLLLSDDMKEMINNRQNSNQYCSNSTRNRL